MSRIGKLPVKIDAGVTITVDDSNVVTVKGPKGTLSQQMHPDMQIEQDNGVVGVTTGFEKKLEIVGTGYRAQLQGKNLVLNMGYSHPVEFQPIEGITFEVPTPNKISVKGIDKQVVGQIAANIREVRPPEPYKGKGIRYEGETVLRKEGKAGKK